MGFALATGATACEVLVLNIIPLDGLQVVPSQVTLLEGELEILEAVLTGPQGQILGGRPVSWSIDRPDVATITGQGALMAVSEGSAVAEVEVEDLSATVPVLVLKGPTLHLDLAMIAVAGPSGQEAPIDRNVQVTNSGNGALSALSVSVAKQDASGIDWLQGSLDVSGAPATLLVRFLIEALAPGLHRGAVTVSDPAARNGPQVVQVEVNVGDPLPVIELSTPLVQVGAASGTVQPATQDVGITNSGGGVLQGLEFGIRYLSGAQGWLQVTFAGPDAPTMMELSASAQFLGAGTYVAEVDVTAASAPGASATVRIVFVVG